MIIALKSKAEEYMGYSNSAAVVVTPHLLTLYAEDIFNALDYCGLQHLVIPLRCNVVPEASPVYAGYGLGLCSDYMNFTTCYAEERNMPMNYVSAILYTRTALIVTLTAMVHVYHTWEPGCRRLEDFAPGSDARCDQSNEDYYWESMRQRLTEIMVRNQYFEKLPRVLLMGESIQDKTFQRVLRKAVGSVTEKLSKILEDDAVFVAARGAADFAKRAEYNPRNSRSRGVSTGSWDSGIDELCEAQN